MPARKELVERFGALDPATLRRCPQTALDRARTLPGLCQDFAMTLTLIAHS
jgi:hypothetical protein